MITVIFDSRVEIERRLAWSLGCSLPQIMVAVGFI